MIKVNKKLQQSSPGKMTKDISLIQEKDTDGSRMKVWVTPPEKETRLAEELAEGGGIQTRW